MHWPEGMNYLNVFILYLNKVYITNSHIPSAICR